MQSVTIVLDMVKPPNSNKDIPAVVSKSAVEAVIAASVGPMLERVLAAYKAVPDPRVQGQLLYDQSMCEKVFGIVQEMIACGYTPATNITLDAPEGGEEGDAAAAAIASASAVPAASAGALSGGPSVAAQVNPDVAAELTAMQGIGRECEVWHDGRPRRAKIVVSGDKSALSAIFLDMPPNRKEERLDFRSHEIRGLLLNIPHSYKKKMLGRNAKPTASITLEDSAGNAVLHIETATDAQRNILATAIANVVGVVARNN